jgi:pilus assembly protein CpaE
MPLDTNRFETSPQSAWPWRAGMVVDDPKLQEEIAAALAEVRATCVFQISASAPVREVLGRIEQDRPDLLFVEIAATPIPAREWMGATQSADGLPVVAAVHVSADPEHMIGALRAGASEFLSLPMAPAIFPALNRIGARLASKPPAETSQGRIIGIVSAKGGCGCTTVACHLGMALAKSAPERRILVADLDYQTPAVHRVSRVEPKHRAGDTFDSVRKLSSSNWGDYFTPLKENMDILAGPEPHQSALPEPWRIESLFRHINRVYPLALVDLGRHLTPGIWAFLQHVDELMVIAAPDVLALYQTRYIIQTLTSRGFDRGRLRLVLNMSDKTPRDFWIESIEQMFEMKLFGVIPADYSGLAAASKGEFSFPADAPFGKAVNKLAGRVLKNENPGSAKRAA